MNPSRRLASGVLAHAFGIGARAAVQLATLPILFASWDAARVGSWLTLFALPAYFSIFGNSLAGAGATAALASVREGRWDEARAHFRAGWALTTLLTMTILAGALLAARLGENALAASFDLSPDIDLQVVLGWLALYVLASEQTAVLISGLRIAGHYPLGQFILSLIGLAEVAVLAACVVLSPSLAILAAALAALRLGFCGVILLIVRAKAPELFHRTSAPVRTAARQIWQPSLASMVMPLVYALNIQGFTLLVGAYFGALVLAGFVATRTIVRVIDLVAGNFYSLQFNEEGYFDPSAIEARRRRLALSTFLVTLLAMGIGLAILLTGPWLQAAFSVGKTSFDGQVAALLVIAGVLRVLSVPAQAMLAAHNRHMAMTYIYLLGTLVCLALALVLADRGAGLPLIVAALVPAEAFLVIPAYRLLLRELDWNLRDFIRAVVSRQRWRDIAGLVRSALPPR